MRNPFARRPPEPTLTDEQRAELRGRAHTLVWPGFTPYVDARASVADFLVESGDDAARTALLEAEATRVVDEEWAAREAELAGTDGGDYDRLRRAFDALEADGILARMCFTDCQTCGTEEIDDERTPADVKPGAYPWKEWAYTFFHAQDAERLAAPDPMVHLTFSSFRPAADVDPADVAAGRAGDQEAIKRVVAHTDATVGREVATALAEAGLTVSWDGTAATRIAVQLPAWRKPLPPRG